MKSGFFCRAAPLGTPENNRRLHIVQKITKNQTTLNDLPNSIHKLQRKPYRENDKSDIRQMNLPFTSVVKNTTQTQSSTNWNLTLKSPKFTVFKERFFGPPFNFAHEITHETFFFLVSRSIYFCFVFACLFVCLFVFSGIFGLYYVYTLCVYIISTAHLHL